MTDLKDFAEILRMHDWTYHYSDDGSVWRAGEANHKNIMKIAGESPNHARMYQLAYAYYLGSSDMSTDEAAWRWVGAYLWACRIKTNEAHAKAFCFGKNISWSAVDESVTEVKS